MTNSTRTRIAAVLLVLGPLLLTLGDLLRRLVEPAGSPKAAAITHAVAEHPGAWLAAGLLSVAAGLCLVPAALALIPATTGRGSRVTTVGALLVAAGAVASVGHAVAFYAPYALFARAGTPDRELAAIDTTSESYPLLVVLIALFIVGTMLGSLVLLVGLRRARRVPIWSVVAAVVFVGCGSAGGVGPGVVGVAAALAAFVPAARALMAGGPAASVDSPRAAVAVAE
jgi:hypothetical protein